jgi:mersacidin/lichenicidin family type 2 lantibiotic
MKFDIVRAWKDAAYRQSLSSDDLALLPANPVGEIELSDADLESIQGAHGHSFGMGSIGIGSYNSLAAAACTNSSAAASFCISFGIGCGIGG